jgi:hypothetical protein
MRCARAENLAILRRTMGRRSHLNITEENFRNINCLIRILSVNTDVGWQL